MKTQWSRLAAGSAPGRARADGCRLAMPVLAALGLACAAALPGAAAAAGYPDRPIRLIVPYSPGGSTDQLGRIIQKPLGEILGQPVVVENKPGAGGSIGVEQVSRAAPDGYTLIFGNSGPSATVSLMRKTSYDPLRDFQPIGVVAMAPLALVVSRDLPVRTLTDFVELSRKPGSNVNYASVGTGSLGHLTGEYFNHYTGARMQHIPYSGGGAQMVAIVGGEVAAAWVNPLDGTPIVATGKARYLAVATPRRLASLPEVPTVGESYPGFASSAWFGILGPAGMPADVVAKLNAAVAEVVARPEVVKALADRKVEPRSTSPQEMRSMIEAELEQWAPVIARSGIHM